VIFNPLHSRTNQQLLEKNSSIKVAAIEIMDDFYCKWKPLRAYHIFSAQRRALVSPIRMHSGMIKASHGLKRC